MNDHDKFNLLKHKARLNSIYEFGPYREENAALHRYEDQPVNGCLRK
jgi:hypothetical protein